MGFRPTIWKKFFFYKFLGGVFSGNTCKKCGYTRASPWYILEVACTVPTICFTVWFMFQQYVYGFQVVVLWLYMSYKFCVDILHVDILHFSSVAIIDVQVLLFNINIWVNFLYFVTTVKFFKMIFRFNLPIDHLHKLISPLSI